SGIYFCNTTYCNQEAAYLKALVSSNTKPCDDFYRYVCDGWSSQNPVNPFSPTAIVSRNTVLQDLLARHLISLIQSGPPDVKIAAQMHSACLNHNKHYIAAVENMFSNWVIRTWPLTNVTNWDLSHVWTFAAELVRDLDLATLIVVSVGVHPDIPGKVVIELDQPSFLLGRADHSASKMVTLFADAVQGTIAALGGQVVSKFEESLINVSRSLASIVRSTKDGRKDYRLEVIGNLDPLIQSLLEKTFRNIFKVMPDQKLLLKSPQYVRTDIATTLSTMQNHDILNYMGFMVLVHVAPFFPRTLLPLRSLFVKAILGRSGSDLSDTSLLCFYAVQRLLPACFAKAALLHQRATSSDVTLRGWISRLERVFIDQLDRFTWVEDLSALLVRYRLRRNPVTSFPETAVFGSDECVFPDAQNHLNTQRPLQSFFDISILNQQLKLQAILTTKIDKVRRHLSGCDLSTEPKYDPTWQKVSLPLAVFNNSVPSNSSAFTFHLSRVAVRFYRALVQMLFENVYEHEVPFLLSEKARRNLTSLLSCFKNNLMQLPISLRVSTVLDEATLIIALLEHTAALRLSLEAFRQLNHISRIWKLDFRFEHLPELSAEQLFFVYFALDNCESVSSAHVTNEDVTLPARYRVNLALRHLSEFSDAFSCGAGSVLPAHYKCSVFEQERKRSKRR
ncbi:unnamed protein product, partial [Ixodes persulcatus]